MFLKPLLPWAPFITELMIVKMVLQDCFGSPHKEWEWLAVVHVDEKGKMPFHPIGVIVCIQVLSDFRLCTRSKLLIGQKN
jgi:hypothetical protein